MTIILIPHTYFFYEAEHSSTLIIIEQMSVEKLFYILVAWETILSTKLVLVVTAILVNLLQLKLRKIQCTCVCVCVCVCVCAFTCRWYNYRLT